MRGTRVSAAMTLGALPLLLSVFLLAGCPSPNTYSTPRTIGSGRVSHSIALESFAYRMKPPPSEQGTVAGSLSSGAWPNYPTYVLRVGLGERFELGARLANFTSFGADFKWNFFRSRGVDLALDPGGQYFSRSSTSNGETFRMGVSYLHVPLLVGFNFGESFTLVLSPGFSVGILSGELAAQEGITRAAAISGLIGRFGVGMNIRFSRNFALHPEVTALQGFDDYHTTAFLIGLGFNFGSLPRYEEWEPPPPPAYYQPPGYYPPPAGYPPPPAAYPPPPAP